MREAVPRLEHELLGHRGLEPSHQAELVRMREMRMLRQRTNLVEQRARPWRLEIESVARHWAVARTDRRKTLDQNALVVDEVHAGPRALVGCEARRRHLELRRERASHDALDAHVARREAVQSDLDLEAHRVAKLRLRRRGA